MADESAVSDFSALSEAGLMQRITSAEDEGARWSAVMELQRRGTDEAFAAAITLTENMSPKTRAIGAGILGQIGLTSKESDAEAVINLMRLLGDESPEVLASAATALSHRRSACAVPVLARLVHHSDPAVRLSVVHGLSGLEVEAAISALIALTGDAETRVRDWATFSLGQLVTADSPAVRQALVDRLADEDAEVRIEGLCGLAQRRDLKAYEVLKSVFIGPPDDIATGHLKAARDLKEPRLLPALEALKTMVDDGTDGFWCSCLEGALAACRSAQTRSAAA